MGTCRPSPPTTSDTNRPTPGPATIAHCACTRCGRIDPTTYTITKPPGTQVTFLLTCDHAYVWTI